MDYLTSLPSWAGCAGMIAVTALLTVSAVVPTTPLNFAAGIICKGFLPGNICFNLGATLGSWINFMLGRRCLRNWATRKLKGSPKMMALERSISNRAAEMVILARLSPVFPFAVLGYILGATKIGAFEFTYATFLGLCPGVALYTWIGMSMASAVSSDDDSASWSSYISIIIGVASTVLISVKAKQVLDEATKTSE